jgi:16S rRNA (guanine527-N7)-methyltransferase
LQDGLHELAMTPAGRELADLERLLQLLDKWNRAFNLTGVRDIEEMVARHILDSLTVRSFLHGSTVLDVGTGAGFPGLPLAIVEPERQFCLLDSGGKKIRFVRHAVAELQLDNVSVVQGRVEEYAPADLFDTVLCRAFASIGKFVGLCGALTAPGGRLLAMKGRFPDDELGELLPSRASPVRDSTFPGAARWQATQTASVQIPGLAVQRHIVVIERPEPECAGNEPQDASGRAPDG